MTGVGIDRILALFVHARRRHAGLAPRVLEKQLTLAKGSVAAIEARRAVEDRDRHVLAAWCGLDLTSREQASPAAPAGRAGRAARSSRADTADAEPSAKVSSREAVP